MLTDKQKKDIYALLIDRFHSENEIPLASVSLFLNKEIDYKKAGYPKRRSLLNDLPFVERKRQEGSPNVTVILHTDVKQIKKEGKKKPSLGKVKQLLKKQFTKGNKYPLSKVSKYLADNQIDYRTLGYSKRKSLLLDRKDILVLDESDKTNISVCFLPEKEGQTIEKTSKTQAKKIVKTTKPVFSDNGKEAPSPDEHSFYIPETLVLSIKEFSDLGLEDDSITKRIEDDYRADLKAGKIHYDEEKEAFLFPLSFKTKNGEDVIGSVKKSAPNRDYDYYLNFIGSDKRKPKDTLRSRIYFPQYEESIAQLAFLAKKESWCYHGSKDHFIILKIYLQYTFYRLVSQKKFCFDEKSGFGCFNTGLKNEEYEDIYGVVRKSKDETVKEEYLFQGFCTAASQGLGKIVVEHFSPLPFPASYITSPSQLVYDTSKDLLTDYHHIIEDNIDRFPFEWLYHFCSSSPVEKGILDKIRKEKNDYRKSILYEQLEKAIERNTFLFRVLKTALENTISKAIRRVKDDYRLAFPSFFPTRDAMSIRLPLEFGADKDIKAVLLVEKMPSGNYQGQTILTLKRAYVNARLMGPLVYSYLNPDKIED